jgi:ABC-type amino acid transport substrate-binding protein
MLAMGDVNVVSVPEDEGRAAAERLALAGRIRALEGIGQGQPLHVVSPRASETGPAFIALINQGLAEMRSSGSYERIVANHLAFAGIN